MDTKLHSNDKQVVLLQHGYKIIINKFSSNNLLHLFGQMYFSKYDISDNHTIAKH